MLIEPWSSQNVLENSFQSLKPFLTLWRKSWMSCGPTVLCNVYTGLPHWFFWHTSSRTFDQVNKFTLITIRLTKFSLSNYVQLIQSVKASHNGKCIDVWSLFVTNQLHFFPSFFSFRQWRRYLQKMTMWSFPPELVISGHVASMSWG